MYVQSIYIGDTVEFVGCASGQSDIHSTFNRTACRTMVHMAVIESGEFWSERTSTDSTSKPGLLRHNWTYLQYECFT